MLPPTLKFDVKEHRFTETNTPREVDVDVTGSRFQFGVLPRPLLAAPGNGQEGTRMHHHLLQYCGT